MVTEILGLMIAVGAILVFGVRYISGRQENTKELQEDMQQSTKRLKAELERSGDAVVKRLGTHVAHLEGLIKEADAKNAMLEAKLSESRRLEADFKRQLQDLENSLDEARAENRKLADARAAHLREREEWAQKQNSEPVPSSSERLDAMDFAQVLQKSIKRSEHLGGIEDMSQDDSQSLIGEPMTEPPQEGQPLVNAQQAAGLAEAMNKRDVPDKALEDSPAELAIEEREKVEPSHHGPTPDTAAAKARAMLLSGYSVEEVSRDTGLGKRAVELVREMSRHDLEKV